MAKKKKSKPIEQPDEEHEDEEKKSAAEDRGLKYGVGCLTAVGLFMSLFGLLIGVAILRGLWDWVDMRGWAETPATILESELVTDPGDDGGATFEVKAKYAYEFAGKRYESTRVGIHEGGDNLGTYHHDKARSLEDARVAGRTHPCYVNPDDPSQAILFRDLRLGVVTFKLLMMFIFSGAGVLLIVLAIAGKRRIRREEAFKSSHPEEPWMWRKDWAAGRIRSSSGVVAWFITVFAVIWNGAIWPICYVIWSGQRDVTVNLRWLLGIFPLAGAFLAVWAMWLWWRRLRWGTSELELAAVPGVLGGPLAGLIHVPRGIDARDGFFLKLKCIRKVERNIGGESSHEDVTEWEHETRVPREAARTGGGRSVIPVQLMIPYDLPSSKETDIRWMLEATAETPGIDYLAAFEVPVFKTAASSRELKELPPSTSLTEEEELVDFDDVVERMRAVLQRESASGARTLLFPAGRNRFMAIYSVGFLTVWIALLGFLYTISVPWWVRGIVYFLAFLSLVSVLINCFWRTTLEFGRHGVIREWKFAGIRSRKEFLPGQIVYIFAKRSGTHFGNTVYREVALETIDKKTYSLVTEIPRGPDAERLAAEIRQSLRRDDESEPPPEPSDMTADLPDELR